MERVVDRMARALILSTGRTRANQSLPPIRARTLRDDIVRTRREIQADAIYRSGDRYRKRVLRGESLQERVATLNSHIPAHASITTVAPFRAWRGSRYRVARGPSRVTITGCQGMLSAGRWPAPDQPSAHGISGPSPSQAMSIRKQHSRDIPTVQGRLPLFCVLSLRSLHGATAHRG